MAKEKHIGELDYSQVKIPAGLIPFNAHAVPFGAGLNFHETIQNDTLGGKIIKAKANAAKSKP